MAEDLAESPFVEMHIPCPNEAECGSHDAASKREDGSYFCFSCNRSYPADGQQAKSTKPRKPLTDSDKEVLTIKQNMVIRALPARGLTQATCRAWNYGTRVLGADQIQHVTCYPDSVKIRNVADKSFFWVGEAYKGLYGKWLWGSGGKQVVITEGEIDALSVSQCYGDKWPVVSVPQGVQSAHKAIVHDLEWLCTFEKIILFLDDDSPGKEATLRCAEMLPPGRAYIAVVPGFKDANEALLAKKQEQITLAIHTARRYQPDGIVDARSLKDAFLKPPTQGMPWSLDHRTKWTYGRRYGELYTFGAGIGAGKSSALLQEIAFTIAPADEHLPQFSGPGLHQACAVFGWENSPDGIVKEIVGKLRQKLFHIPDPDNTGLLWKPEDQVTGWEYFEQRCAPLYVNDHYGVAEWDSVKDRIRYLAHGLGVKHVVLDPLTALIGAAEDERKEAERVMAELAGLAAELRICAYVASHLATPEGDPHEEGGRVKLRHFKGSRAIGAWTHFAFGFERDQQEQDGLTTERCLKARLCGWNTGKTQALAYNNMTGILEATLTGVAPGNISPLET